MHLNSIVSKIKVKNVFTHNRLLTPFRLCQCPKKVKLQETEDIHRYTR